METSTQVLHIEKRISIAAGLDRHITRKQFVSDGEDRTLTVWVPDNADPSRTADNVELVSRQFTNARGQKNELTLQQAVDKRIREAGIKPRKGQTTCLEMIFSGSHDVMVAKSKVELRQWAEDTLKWAQKQWGKENVVSASLHVDEMTPHIHMIVVPIVTGQSRRTRNYKLKSEQQGKPTRSYKIDHNKPRLCVNEVFTTGKLYEYHDSYAKEVSMKYGLDRGVKAEPGSIKKHTTSIEYNRMLAVQAAEQQALIEELTSDYEEKKAELQEDIQLLQEGIAANAKTIAQQRKMISDNEATIQKQEKLKSSTVINDDAADRAILLKYNMVSVLADEELRLRRTITDMEVELATVNANVQNRRKQLTAQADLDSIPKKGLMGGYRTEDVDKYLESVNAAKLRQAMNYAPGDIKVDEEIQKEVIRLRAIEDEYKSFLNSPERMKRRIIDLATEAKRRSIVETLKYALRKDVEVKRFGIEQTPEGDDIFVRFTIKGDQTLYAGRITPDEYICYTSKPLNSLQEVKDHWEDEIWYLLGYLWDIRARREIEDTLSRYSTKLSTLLQERIKVTDYVSEGKHYLLFASNGRTYEVNPEGRTWSTGDGRVRTLADCQKYSQEKIWTNHGNINEPPLNRGLKIGR